MLGKRERRRRKAAATRLGALPFFLLAYRFIAFVFMEDSGVFGHRYQSERTMRTYACNTWRWHVFYCFVC